MNNECGKYIRLIMLCAKSGNVVYGTDACISEIKKRKAYLAVVSSAASVNTKKRITDKCSYYHVKCIEADEMISDILGKENSMVFAIKDKDFSKIIMNCYEKELRG